MRRAVALLLALLTACAPAPAEGDQYLHRGLEYVEMDTPEGRVGCVLYTDSHKAGLSCDWWGMR